MTKGIIIHSTLFKLRTTYEALGLACYSSTTVNDDSILRFCVFLKKLTWNCLNLTYSIFRHSLFLASVSDLPTMISISWAVFRDPLVADPSECSIFGIPGEFRKHPLGGAILAQTHDQQSHRSRRATIAA